MTTPQPAPQPEPKIDTCWVDVGGFTCGGTKINGKCENCTARMAYRNSW